MRVALFVPCYVDQFYPQVGMASLELLEKLGLAVDFPMGQTCCGQPMANAGFESKGIPAAKNFVKVFAPYDYVVAPSGSCVYHVRSHFDVLPDSPDVRRVRANTYEICDFIQKFGFAEKLGATFPHKVGLHQSCHGLRGLRLGSCSEKNDTKFSIYEDLLQGVKGLKLQPLQRVDECCGFGGTFAVAEEAVSVRMGQDRIMDHLSAGVDVITGGDTSCLMHLEGLIRRQNSPIKVMHIIEILNSRK